MNSVLGEIIEFSGLEDFIDSPVKHYSSGMYVRLGFAVAVHVNPEILMIDEVIAVGDEEFQRRCFDHIYRLRRQGVTIVMVSHGAPLMEQMCDEVAWLEHGQLMAKGDPSEVVRKYLEKVNVVENERRSTVGEVPAPTTRCRRHRRAQGGEPEVEIPGFELLDASGHQLAAGSTGRPVDGAHSLPRELVGSQPVFGLGFNTDSACGSPGRTRPSPVSRSDR